MRFVPVKTAEQQAALLLVGVRDRLIRNRTQLANTIRGYAVGFGLAAWNRLAEWGWMRRNTFFSFTG
jgi:transposase